MFIKDITEKLTLNKGLKEIKKLTMQIYKKRTYQVYATARTKA